MPGTCDCSTCRCLLVSWEAFKNGTLADLSITSRSVLHNNWLHHIVSNLLYWHALKSVSACQTACSQNTAADDVQIAHLECLALQPLLYDTA